MKNIVICADGTDNTFGAEVSNVSRLIQLIDLDNPERQVAFYDQSIGTDPRYVNAVKAYKDREHAQRRALSIVTSYVETRVPSYPDQESSVS